MGQWLIKQASCCASQFERCGLQKCSRGSAFVLVVDLSTGENMIIYSDVYVCGSDVMHILQTSHQHINIMCVFRWTHLCRVTGVAVTPCVECYVMFLTLRVCVCEQTEKFRFPLFAFTATTPCHVSEAFSIFLNVCSALGMNYMRLEQALLCCWCSSQLLLIWISALNFLCPSDANYVMVIFRFAVIRSY